jgi:Tol biopolymer transport system component/tRNA A-37 threonylcarbamoyl transferase component Bud32
MPLTPGTKLHAYEITGPIGAGGMGEVYRAHDARLGRDVAIKVLPASVSADPPSLARFEREARAIGALNHPNIVNVFDTGSDRGVSYVVMELLEGETLRSRLQGSSAHTIASGTKTPRPAGSQGSGSARAQGIPRKKALEIAQQIAQGLAAAHARGIVHRDLKPDNIFLTHDGRVKILDFGLARAVPEATDRLANAQTQVSPTIASDSMPGLVLGTVGYMAPEQVRGQPVDHRADIFAFGVVLYEMLTGERAFDSESPIETMSAILKADPLDQPAATVAISGPLEPLLRHCLEKQPDERFQSARDLAFQLQAIASGSLSTSSAERAVAPPPGVARRVMIPALIVLALAIGAAAGYWAAQRGAVEEEISLAVPMPVGARVFPGPSPARSGGIAVSRDGRSIAFAGATAAVPVQIYVRTLDSPAPRPVPGTEGGWGPTWSPDGRRLAFLQAGKLKVTAIDGGSAQAVTDVPNPRSAASWSDGDELLYHPDYRSGLLRVPAAGGTPSEVLPALGGNKSWFSPVWLPDGKRFLVVRWSYADAEADGAGIYVGSVDSKEPALLVAGRISEVALGDGELFYRRGTELVAQPFDARAAKLSGESRVLSDHVSLVAAAGGTVVYFDPPGGLSFGHRIAMFSRAGAILSHVGGAGTFRDPRLSPDGRHLAVARGDENGLFSIWTYDLARNIDTRVTPATFVCPAWSPDGQSIFAGSAAGLHRFDMSGGGQGQVVRTFGKDTTSLSVVDVSSDGRDALVVLIGTPTAQLAAVPLGSPADPRPVGSPQPLNTQNAAFSPDGRWIARVAMEGSTLRLFVQPSQGPGARVPVTAAQALYPRWRGDGRELYFLGDGGQGAAGVMAVPVTWTANGPDFGQPEMLFKIEGIVLSNLAIDVTTDGQKFVAIVTDKPEPWPITVRLRR